MITFLKKRSTVKNYAFVLLIAIECLMSFTFLGYIHVPPISITYAYIPILVAGCFLGVWQSTALGFLFGLASMYKATAFYVMSSDKIFSPFMSDNPLGSLILSVGTRTLFGFLIGILFLIAKKCSHKRTVTGIIALLSPSIHASLVYGAIDIFFPQNGSSSRNGLLNISNILASIVCILLIEILLIISRLKVTRNFCKYVNQPTDSHRHKSPLYIGWAVFIVLTLIAAVASSYYFANRISYMLTAHGVTLSSEIDHDLLHLQYQFMLAAFSLNFIMAISLVIIYKYLSYKEYLSELDDLTNVMGRRIFFDECQNIAADTTASQCCFVFIDVDYFKKINDTFGHLTGDKVLREIAHSLQQTFREYGKIGRLGGDEFAIIMKNAPEKEILAEKFDLFEKNISNLIPDYKAVSCSIGAYYFMTPQDFQLVYSSADNVLYEAKEKGRSCYVIR